MKDQQTLKSCQPLTLMTFNVDVNSTNNYIPVENIELITLLSIPKHDMHMQAMAFLLIRYLASLVRILLQAITGAHGQWRCVSADSKLLTL